MEELRMARTTSSQLEFLTDWFAYHDVLHDYSMPREETRATILGQNDHTDNQVVGSSMIRCQSFTADTLQIIGPLGCSRGVLACISRINRLRMAEGSEDAREIREHLQSLEQTMCFNGGEASNAVDISRILLTAELYRKATLLYLEQVDAASSAATSIIAPLLDDCFSILDRLGLCTSPWPLFIIASWCTKDEHRIKILSVLEAMHIERHIQNVMIIEQIIRTLWQRMDLCDTEKRKFSIDWRDFVDSHNCMPSFI